MELVMAITTGLLFAVAVYLILSRSVLRIILGTSLLTHGVHLLLLSMAGLKTGVAPLIGKGTESYTDPLPQALILTSIVINFGVTAFFLVLAYRANQTLGTDDVEKLRGGETDE